MTIFFGLIGFVVILAFIINAASEQNKREEKQKKWFPHALNHLKDGNFKILVDWYKKRDGFEDSPIQIIVQIGEFMQKDSPQSIQKLTERYSVICSTIKPSLCQAYINYANRLFANRNYSSAKKWYQLAYEQETSADSCIWLGLYYLQLKDYLNAAHFLKETLRYKKNFTILYNLFLVYIHLNYCKEALQIFKQLRQEYFIQLARKKKILTEIPLEHLTEIQK